MAPGDEENLDRLQPDIDLTIFQQILEMDDDDEKEFSMTIVEDFFEQAHTSLDEMDAAVADKDLKKLSNLGHFLKGSSAALGMTKVRDSCEKIQHWGEEKDATGDLNTPIPAKVAFQNIEKEIKLVKIECESARSKFSSFYEREMGTHIGEE